MQGRITKRAVDLMPADAGEIILWDTEIKGFGIRARGTATKSYIIQYRAGRGRRAPIRKLTIGKHGSPWTPDTARIEAKRILGLVAGGADPATDRDTEGEDLSFSELCDLYLSEGVGHKKLSTIKADKARIEHHLKPLLGKHGTRDLNRTHIERMLIDVKGGRKILLARTKRGPGSTPSGGPGVGAQCVALVSSIYSFAIGRRLATENPAKGVKKPRVRSMQRFLSQEELLRLGGALRLEGVSAANQFAVAAIWLLLFTGARRGEILSLRWDQVDFDRLCLRLPDSKTGSKVIYLNDPAINVLRSLPRLANNPFVIAGTKEGGRFVAIDKVWFKLRKIAGLSDVRLHDLRHSFASVGVAEGAGLPILGALLGHKHTSTTARYAHLADQPVRQANNMIGERLASLTRF